MSEKPARYGAGNVLRMPSKPLMLDGPNSSDSTYVCQKPHKASVTHLPTSSPSKSKPELSGT